MSSYAPLLAKDKHYSWTPDLIYFNNNEVRPTANYYVQRAFGHNAGDVYVGSKVDVTVVKAASDAKDKKNSPSQENLERGISERIDRSVVIDSKTGDVIIKLVSMLPKEAAMTIDLGEEVAAKLNKATTSKKSKGNVVASIQTMCGGNAPDHTKEWEGEKTENVTLTSPQLQISVAPYSLTVIRVK
jgi:alpha-L-arabinofuranosidase